jgi:hypothetical protein
MVQSVRIERDSGGARDIYAAASNIVRSSASTASDFDVRLHTIFTSVEKAVRLTISGGTKGYVELAQIQPSLAGCLNWSRTSVQTNGEEIWWWLHQ